MFIERYIIIGIVLFIIFLFKKTYNSIQPTVHPHEHEITVFAIPSVEPMDWESPSSLYKSALKCYLKSSYQRTYYIIGHMSAMISSPLLESVIYAGMTGASQIEKVQQVILKRAGMGVFGTTLKGKMEPVEKMKKTISFYGRRNKVAFMRFKVNEDAIKRVIQFIGYFKNKNELGYAPCEYYNGALNPRYKYEGAACSSFIIALMQVAGILPPNAPQDWAVNLKIPMHLIGGKLNANKRISLKSIMQTKAWHDGSGLEGVDYASLELYDPAMVFDWVQKQRAQEDSAYAIENDGVFNGVYKDLSTISFAQNNAVLQTRNEVSFFVKNFLNTHLNGHLKSQSKGLLEVMPKTASIPLNS